MANHRVLLDTFADVRRTWDELVGLQPDVVVASGQLNEIEMVELERRVTAHQQAVAIFADALEAEPRGTRLDPRLEPSSIRHEIFEKEPKGPR
jgi:hypothetical protein